MGVPERGVDGETAATVEAWPVTLSGCEAMGEMRVTAGEGEEEAGLSLLLLRMLAMVKEVGVDLVVGEFLDLGGCAGATLVFTVCASDSSVLAGRDCDAATAGRGKEGICTCSVKAFCCCCCAVEREGKVQGRVRAGRPTPGRSGRCMHAGYTDIILEAAS